MTGHRRSRKLVATTELAMIRTAVGCLVVMAALAAGPANAIDAYATPPTVVVTSPPAAAVASPPVVVNPPPIMTPAPRVVVRTPGASGEVAVGPPSLTPDVQYGCQRVWRCDSIVCEWRRGCWGVYGYMEGPYYTVDFARRQWETHGWPTPRTKQRHRHHDKQARDQTTSGLSR
jgi:hypothetical protein